MALEGLTFWHIHPVALRTADDTAFVSDNPRRDRLLLSTNLLRQIQVRFCGNKHAWNVIQRVLLLDRLLLGELKTSPQSLYTAYPDVSNIRERVGVTRIVEVDYDIRLLQFLATSKHFTFVFRSELLKLSSCKPPD